MQRILGILMMGLLAGQVLALPALEWRFPSFPLRTVFRVPDAAHTNVMLRVDRVGNMPVTPDGFLACDPYGVPFPVSVVHAEGREVVLLLEAHRSGAGSFAVYYGGKRPDRDLAPVQDAVVDQTPLAVGFSPLKGRAIPNSWERLRHMLKASPGQVKTPYQVSGFDDITSAMNQEDSDWESRTKGETRRRGTTKSAMRVVTLRSYLLCHSGGTYHFAVDCRDAGFVVVDGELVAAWPGEHEPGSWQLGAPVPLTAGVHRVEVFNAFQGGQPKLRVGWSTPGRQEITALSKTDLIASCEAMDTRAERMNRTLQPGFVATLLQSYAFRGHPAVFQAVRFDNITENWITPRMESHWRFGDGTQSEERNPVHIYRSDDIFKASLEVRDELGFVAGCSKTVDCRQVRTEEYAVSFEMTGLPAVCFGRDKVAPSLRMEGVGPTNVTLDVNWEFRRRSGVQEQGTRQLAPGGQPQWIHLPSVAAGELESLNWTVRHRQTALGGERIRFVHPPFTAIPARIVGDRIFDAKGTRLVLVPDEGLVATRNETPVLSGRPRRLVCVDDSLAIPGLKAAGCESFDRILARLLTGRVGDVRYAELPGWDQFPESYGPLRKLVDVPAALNRERADIAILSIGLPDILAAKDVDIFECQAAALTDVVASSTKRRTVWVTPPPYPSAPVRSRAFAAAIRRVAKSRGIPVADLYTAFLCVTDSRHVFFQENPLVLSEAGHRLAGQQIVRALMGE